MQCDALIFHMRPAGALLLDLLCYPACRLTSRSGCPAGFAGIRLLSGKRTLTPPLQVL